MHGRILLAGLLLCATVAAQPAPVTLYAHLVDVQDFPLNTQLPDAAYGVDAGYGIMGTQLTCAHGTTGSLTGGLTSQAYATYYGYITPDTMDYDRVAPDGEPIRPFLRTLYDDVRLNASRPMDLVWYLSMSAAPENLPAPMPAANIVLRATLRAGSEISPQQSAYNAGPLVARAETSPVTLAGDQVQPASPHVRALGLVEGRWIYEFRVPFMVEASVIPREGANLRIDLYMDNPLCDPDTGTFQTTVFQHSSAAYRPRMEFAIDNPVSVVSTGAQWVSNDLLLTFEASSTWGMGDLNRDAIELDVVGPGPSDFQAHVMRYDHDEGHRAPRALTWIWVNATREARAGHYEVTLTAPNLQGTATLSASTSFDVAPPRQSPMLPALVWSVGLVGLAALLRRR